MIEKIENKKRELEEHPTNTLEANNRMRNVPRGPLADRWTNETLVCPACGVKGLDQFEGGPDVQDGAIHRTQFIYHCRVCDLNLTEEEYQHDVAE